MGIFAVLSQKLLPNSKRKPKLKKEEIHETKVVTTPSSKQNSSKEGYIFRYNEDGRRCQGDEEIGYIFPNDDDETDRLHQQHWILRYILQRNFFAPVTDQLKEGIKTLDVGCGPGTWVLELAEAFPKSTFHGIDVTSVFPERIMPNNIKFEIGNVAKGLTFIEDNTFDYIHQRLLVTALTDDNWTTALAELYRILKPGGYIELQEFSAFNMDKTGPNWQKLQARSLKLLGSLNMPTEICIELEDRLLKAGFVNQKLTVTPMPINYDGKKGKLLWEDLKHAYLNVRPPMAKIYHEYEDIGTYEKFIEDIGVESAEYKTDVLWFSCYAQKPAA